MAVSEIRVRRDTEANWLLANPVLASGEPTVAWRPDGTSYMRVGDGVRNWAELPDSQGPKGDKGDDGDITPELYSAKEEAVSAAARAEMYSNNVVAIQDNAVSELINSGSSQTRSAVQALVSGKMLISVSDFGAVGDGLADDTVPVRSLFKKALEIGKAAYFPKGTYRIVSNESWDIPAIESDNAVLDVTGTLRLLTVGDASLRGFTLRTDDGAGYGASSAPNLNYIIRPKGGHGLVKTNLVEDVQVFGKVSTGRRISGSIRLAPASDFVSIKNVTVYNTVCGIGMYGNSNNVSVRDVWGKNVECLVQAQEVTDGYFNNLDIVNTSTDFEWWVGSSVGVGINGKDTLLLQAGNRITMDGIRGEYCIERPVYCIASNIYATNLESVNTGCFKFVGMVDGTRVSKNIYVGDAVIRETVSNTRDSYGQVYECENIYFDNLKIYSDGMSKKNNFYISRYNGKVVFNNIEYYGATGPLFAKGVGVTESVTINKMYYEGKALTTVDSMVMEGVSGIAAVDIIGKLVIKDFVANNSAGFNSRSIVSRSAASPVASSVELWRAEVNGTGATGATNMYGFPYLRGVLVGDLKVKTSTAIPAFTGTSMQANRNLDTDSPIGKLTVESVADPMIKLSLEFSKQKPGSALMLDLLSRVSVGSYDTNDYSFETPAKVSRNWIVTVRSLIEGFAEFYVVSGAITLSRASGNNIVIGGAPSAGKITIYESGGFVAFRNRVAGDTFTVTVAAI